MFRSLLLIATAAFAVSACDNAANTDAGEETSCSTTTGTWYLQSASCNGVDQSPLPPVNFVFSSGNLAVNLGDESCVATGNFTIGTGLAAAILGLTGSGDYSCSASGASVANCSGATFSCSNTNTVDALDATYSSCAISSGTMTMSRTVTTAVNAAGLTPCSDGEVEQFVLSTTAPDPGTPPAGGILTISEADPYSFGTAPVGSVFQHSFTVTNTSSTLTATGLAGSGLSSPFNFEGGAYPGTTGTCGATLAPASTCQIVVQYSPVATGFSNDTIDINYTADGASLVSSRTVAGNAVAPASLFISDGPSYNFGSVPVFATADRIFTITNAGGYSAGAITEVGLGAPFSFTGGAYPGAGGTCTFVLSAGATCDIEVRFSPTSMGVFNDTIDINYNNGVNVNSTTRNISGTGM